MAIVPHLQEEANRRETPSASRALGTLWIDLSESLLFEKRKVSLYLEKVVLSDSSEQTIHEFYYDDITEVKSELLTGMGKISFLLKNGKEVFFCAYSLSLSSQGAELAGALENLIRKELFHGLTDQKDSLCPSCGGVKDLEAGCPRCGARRESLKRLIPYVKQHRNTFFLLMAVNLFMTATTLVPPYFQGQLVDQVFQRGGGTQKLLILVGLWTSFVLLIALLQNWNQLVMTKLGLSIGSDLRKDAFAAMERLQISFFDKRRGGSIGTRILRDTDALNFFLIDGAPFFINNSLLILGVIILIFRVNVLLGTALILPVPLIAFFAMYSWKEVTRGFRLSSERHAQLANYVQEVIQGIRTIKIFSQEKEAQAHFEGKEKKFSDAHLEAESRWTRVFRKIAFLTSTGTLINWSLGGYLVLQGKLTLGNLLQVNAYLALIYGPLMWLAQVVNWFTRATVGAERIFELIDGQKEPALAVVPQMSPLKGKVEFQDVRFGYERGNPVLKGVSFSVSEGEMIGLVGHSGAGKSTAIHLLARFYEPLSGKILIDGKDYTSYPLEAYRKQIGVVLQEPFLFFGTIAENIAYGKPDASFKEIIDAARAANAHEFILAKPDGYDSVIGERGIKLSGGEKQRISIARAILHNPRILILDEATSSVDVETERKIQEAITRLTTGRTTLAIAHRLSTLQHASRLLVFERGKIVEEGTHEELLARRGVFFKLAQTQSKLSNVIGI